MSKPKRLSSCFKSRIPISFTWAEDGRHGLSGRCGDSAIVPVGHIPVQAACGTLWGLQKPSVASLDLVPSRTTSTRPDREIRPTSSAFSRHPWVSTPRYRARHWSSCELFISMSFIHNLGFRPFACASTVREYRQTGHFPLFFNQPLMQSSWKRWLHGRRVAELPTVS